MLVVEEVARDEQRLAVSDHPQDLGLVDEPAELGGLADDVLQIHLFLFDLAHYGQHLQFAEPSFE